MYALIKNGKATPYSIEKLRQDNPNISFPSNMSDARLAEFNVVPFTREDPPAANPAVRHVPGPITFNGPTQTWTQGWIAQPIPVQDRENQAQNAVNQAMERSENQALVSVLARLDGTLDEAGAEDFVRQDILARERAKRGL